MLSIINNVEYDIYKWYNNMDKVKSLIDKRIFYKYNILTDYPEYMTVFNMYNKFMIIREKILNIYDLNKISDIYRSDKTDIKDKRLISSVLINIDNTRPCTFLQIFESINILIFNKKINIKDKDKLYKYHISYEIKRLTDVIDLMEEFINKQWY